MSPGRDISQLIFVVGFPRSGTTWFSNLINSHPDTIYRHEVFGREYASFGEELFRKLRFDNGLSDTDYKSALRVLLQARVATDRPPFFRKRFRPRTPVALQQLVWLAANASPMLAPVYTRIFTPRRCCSAALVVKETGSGVNLDSIIKNTRSDKLVILIRHPYAVVASHFVGQRRGKMRQPSAALRCAWLKHHRECAYVASLRLTEESVTALSEAEFVAIRWRVQNDLYLDMRSDSRVILYDEFVRDPVRNTEGLLQFLNLNFASQVRQFVIDSTSSTAGSAVLRRDASSEYFSVYRGADYNPHKWRTMLTPAQREGIDRHTAEVVAYLGLDKWVEEVPQRQEQAVSQYPGHNVTIS